MAKYLIDSTDIEIEEVSGTENLKFNLASGVNTRILNLVYPIGSVYISTNNTNPSSLFGGTWQAWGSGCVPVGVDTNQTEFNTVEKTGGSKYLQNHYHEGVGVSDATFTSWSSSGSGNVFDVASLYKAGEPNNNKFTSGAVAGQTTGNSGNLQPYITCYMWKRIS